MAFSSTLYNTIFKRTSTFALACVVSAMFFERTFEITSDYVFDKINEGKLFKDIQNKE